MDVLGGGSKSRVWTCHTGRNQSESASLFYIRIPGGSLRRVPAAYVRHDDGRGLHRRHVEPVVRRVACEVDEDVDLIVADHFGGLAVSLALARGI